MTITRYTPGFAARWDEFAARSRCSSFLFQRSYMDYHADRFADCSLLAFSPRGRLLAMLPAEISGTTVTSHRGLSYGGWITPMRHFNGATMLDIFTRAADYLRSLGAKRLVYTPAPAIYHRVPADEDLYSLFRLGATLTACTLSSAIDLRNPAPRNESTRQALRLAAESGVQVAESADLAGFWSILTECLQSRHNASPVHSLEEISRLAALFPRHIRLFTATIHRAPAAGALVYFCGHTAKIQYMATTPHGRATKALAAVIDHIASVCAAASMTYLDLGGSNESAGTVLNSGLLLQKSGFGATGLACSTFTLPL